MRAVPLRWVALGLLVVALLLAGVASHYASNDPDGLTKVSQDQGFADTAQQHHTADGPLAGYRTRDVGDDRLSGGIAGVAGVLVVLALGTGVAYLVRRRTGRHGDRAGDRPGDRAGDRASEPTA